MEDVKQPSVASMMCTINSNTFFSFMKNTWIGDLGTSCHITNDGKCLDDIIDIDDSIQGSSGIMPATKNSKLQVIVHQVNGEEQVHILWPVITSLGERHFFNISSPSTPTSGEKCHWLLVIYNCSDFCWSFFLWEKSDLAQTMLGLINNLKIMFNLQVQCLCCDNAGKNQAFKRTCKQEGLRIDFEHAAPGTPQQNGYIKCKFATLFNWVCIMFNSGKFTAYLQSSLWAEAMDTSIL